MSKINKIPVFLFLLFLIMRCMEYSPVNPFDSNINTRNDPFTLIAVSDTSAIRLSWNKLSLKGIEKILIYRSTDSTGAYSVLKEIEGNTSQTFIDKIVDPDTIYYYRISLVANGKESSKSLIVNASPIAPRKPRLQVLFQSKPSDTLDFSLNHSSLQVIINNAGSAQLQITKIQSSERWISWSEEYDSSVDPQKQTGLTVNLIRDSLAAREAPYSGSLLINSNGGSWTILILAVKATQKAILTTLADSLFFDTTTTTRQFSIRNDGNTVMAACSLVSTQPWLIIKPGTATKIKPGEKYQFEVTVSRANQAMKNGLNTAMIRIESDGGSGFVTVNAIKKASTTPLLSIKDSVLDFGIDKNVMVQILSNAGPGVLSWHLAVPQEKWYTCVGPKSGSLKEDSSVSVTFKVYQDSVKGNLPVSSVIQVTSNGGNGNFKIVKTPAVPKLAVQDTVLDFGTDKSSMVQVIKNSGNSPMNWRIAVPAEKWILYNGSDSGTVKPDSSITVGFGIVRDSINEAGLYSQKISITSNGGNSSFTIKVEKVEDKPPEASILTTKALKAASVTLVWTKNKQQQFVKYSLYRSSDSTVDNRDKLVYSSIIAGDTVFVDDSVESMNKYYYCVYTTGAQSKNTRSNTVQVLTPAERVLTGSVKDSKSKNIIEGVGISLIGKNRSTVTSGSGIYLFENPESGLVKVLFSKTGYISVVDTLRIKQGENLHNIEMSSLPQKQQTALSIEFSDPGMVICDNTYMYILERDWQTPRVLIVNASTGNEAATVNLSAYCETPGQIGFWNSAIAVSCPAEKKILRITNALSGNPVIEEITVSFEPYGFTTVNQKLFVAGKGASGSGIIAKISSTDLQPEVVKEITSFNAAISSNFDWGPLIVYCSGKLVTSNGNLTTGKLAASDSSGGALTSVDLPWPAVRGLSVKNNYVLVGFGTADADSILSYTAQLNRIEGFYNETPVKQICTAGSSGNFKGMILAASSGTVSPSIYFLQQLYDKSAGTVSFTEQIKSCAISPDGNLISVISGNEVFVIK